MAIVFSQLEDQGFTKSLYAFHHPFKTDLPHNFFDIALLETFNFFS
jgi:hypothetical protein